MKTSLFAPALLVLATGCAGRTLDIGEGRDSLTKDAEVFDADASAPPAVSQPTSEMPVGIWTMSVQYGEVGVAVTPTIPLQLELRADGTAYRWMCAGGPDDGSLTEACAPEARVNCKSTTFAWDGSRWRLDMAPLLTPEQGEIISDGKGNILVPYINPSYSGALFRNIGTPTTGAPACAP